MLPEHFSVSPRKKHRLGADPPSFTALQSVFHSHNTSPATAHARMPSLATSQPIFRVPTPTTTSRWISPCGDTRKPLAEIERCGNIKHDVVLPSKICTNCGVINYACLSYEKDPERFWCCDGGSTILPLLEDYPDLFKVLLTETVPTSNGGIKRSPRSEAFHSQIRQYNYAFAFTSLGVKLD